MDTVYIVQRKQKIRAVVQGKKAGIPVDPLPLPTYCFKVVDMRTNDYCGGDFDTEQLAQEKCNQLNASLARPPTI